MTGSGPEKLLAVRSLPTLTDERSGQKTQLDRSGPIGRRRLRCEPTLDVFVITFGAGSRPPRPNQPSETRR